MSARYLLACILVAGTVWVPAAGAATQKIVIEGMKFHPEVLEAHPGDTVVWTNKDFFPHTATGKTFDSKEIPANGSFKMKVKKKGTFDYACVLHPTMKGTLVVK